MKKKIKELTIAETIVVCNKQYICKGCPLVNVCGLIPLRLSEEHEEDLETEIKI